MLSALQLFSTRSCDVRATEGCDVTQSARESIPGVWRTEIRRLGLQCPPGETRKYVIQICKEA